MWGKTEVCEPFRRSQPSVRRAAGYRVGGGVSVAAAAAVAPPCVRADVRPIRRVSVVGDVRFYSIL